MREILFRGKTPENYWVYGYYTKESPVVQSGRSIIETRDDDFSVVEETVGQYTGLTDKNGKKIFEGDIISTITLDTNTERRAVIGFGHFIDENNGDEYLGFYIEFDGCKATITQLEMEEVKDRFEVIGNIHDNPELLEVE